MRPAPTLQDLYRDIVPDLGGVEDVIVHALQSEKPEIAGMTVHASGHGGKRMRPAIVLLVARAAGDLVPNHVSLAAVVEMIHLATLVHDDVIDEADLRRRRRTIKALWNPHDAVLLGDIIFARAIRVLASMGDTRSLVTLTSALGTVCEGEILQNRRSHDPGLTEETYYAVIDAKTAELYARGCELAAHLAGANEDAIRAFGAFGRELGAAFQITDDCLDLVGTEAEVGKSLGTDLVGGKMTLPLILLRARIEGTPRETFDRVIAEGVVSPDDVSAIAALLRSHGVLDDALDRARGHVATGVAGLRGHVSDEAYATLEAIGAFVLSRSL
jgi:octaprenyl-diphosphate synthase